MPKPLLTTKAQNCVSCLPKHVLMIPKSFVKIFCGLMGSNWNVPESVCLIKSGLLKSVLFSDSEIAK